MVVLIYYIELFLTKLLYFLGHIQHWLLLGIVTAATFVEDFSTSENSQKPAAIQVEGQQGQRDRSGVGPGKCCSHQRCEPLQKIDARMRVEGKGGGAEHPFLFFIIIVTIIVILFDSYVVMFIVVKYYILFCFKCVYM